MKLRDLWIISSFWFAFLIFLPFQSASARSRYISAGDTFEVQVKIKKKSFRISCLGKNPGSVKSTSKGLTFTPYSRLAQRSSGQKRALYQQLDRAGRQSCRNPDFLSLDQYRGQFGEAEARILFDRFAMGASPEQIRRAVSIGLNRTINEMTSYVNTPALDIEESDLRCDGREAGDPENESCDSANVNDFYTPGLRYGIYARFQEPVNGFFNKMFMWLHDERASASSQAGSGGSQHAVIEHVNILRAAARSGDYLQFARAYNNDYLGHLLWLDGAVNRGYSPNENYAREFWELVTVGASDLNGKAVYSDADVAQSALAFSGWTEVWDEWEDGQGDTHWIAWPAYVPGFHHPGTKIVFAGTRYQAAVENAEDVLRATFAHPRTAESLAEDLWKEFINPYATTNSVKQLAAFINRSNFNLTPVMRRIMASRAVFSAKSRRSLIKHPTELLFGFLKVSRYPVSYSSIDSFLQDMAQRPLLPPSVFGWKEEKLAGESYVLEWRNAVISMLNRSDEDLKDDGYNIRAHFLSGLPARESASLELIDRTAAWLNIPLNSAQRSALDQFLNYDREICRSWHVNQYGCTVGQYFLRREAFDAALDAESYYASKLQGMLAILLMQPEYRVK